jgi:DNA-binding MarR family transcriptional regulator
MTAPVSLTPAPSPGSDPTTREIVDLTSALVGRIWGQFMARAAEFSLSLPEAKALQSLEPECALPMRALAARLHANPSNVTVVVARLEARGLIERRATKDRRVTGVVLTPSGLDLKSRLEARLAEDHPAVSGLSPAQRQTLLTLLRRLSAPG